MSCCLVMFRPRRALPGPPSTLVVALGTVLLLGAAAALGGCSQNVRGELTAATCTNARDDDGDRLIDCGDPDCWVFCPAQAPSEINEPDSMPPDETPDAGASSAPRDAGAIISRPDDDSGMPEPPDMEDDAGMPPSCETCPTGEACIDGQCRRTALSGEYELSVLSAVVPLSTPDDKCFDYNNATCSSRIILVCECVRPDPYVVVVLDGKVVQGATTTWRSGTASPVWTEAPTVRVTLSENSKLTFVVYDYDGIGSDTEIFRCSPDLSPLTSDSDVLSCSPDASMTIAPPRSSNFSVAVSVAKAK